MDHKKPRRIGISVSAAAAMGFSLWFFYNGGPFYTGGQDGLSQLRESTRYAAERRAIQEQAKKRGMEVWTFRTRTVEACRNSYPTFDLQVSCNNSAFYGGFGEFYDAAYRVELLWSWGMLVIKLLFLSAAAGFGCALLIAGALIWWPWVSG